MDLDKGGVKASSKEDGHSQHFRISVYLVLMRVFGMSHALTIVAHQMSLLQEKNIRIVLEEITTQLFPFVGGVEPTNIEGQKLQISERTH